MPLQKSRPARETKGNYREMDWDVDISWMLRGLRGEIWNISKIMPR